MINMDIKDIVGLIFAGVSAIFTYLSYRRSKDAETFRNESKDIKKAIEEQLNIQNKIKIEKQELLRLSPKIQKMKEISDAFERISTMAIKDESDTEFELKYYEELKEEMNKVLNDIPEKYSDVRRRLEEIKKALDFCIHRKMIFYKLDRYSEYSYDFVLYNIGEVIKKLDTIILSIQ